MTNLADGTFQCTHCHRALEIKDCVYTDANRQWCVNCETLYQNWKDSQHWYKDGQRPYSVLQKKGVKNGKV